MTFHVKQVAGWRGWASLVLVVGVVGLALGAGYSVHKWWWARGEISRLNALADADSLRLVYTQDSIRVYQRRARVARDVADHVSKVAREQLERANLRARASYDLAIGYRNELVGEQERVQVADQDTRLPIYLTDRELTIQGEVLLRDHIVPPRVRVDARLDAVLDRLGLEVTVAEAADGGLVVQVTTASPHVRVLELEGITDLRSTGVDPPSGRRQAFGWGALVGFIAGVLVP